MKKTFLTLTIAAFGYCAYAQSYLPLTAGSGYPLTGTLITNVEGTNQIALNNPATNWGFVSNPSTDVWSLGYGPSVTTLGTSVLTWNVSGNVGVGTTSPQSILDIGKSQAAPALRIGNSGYGLSYNSVWGLQEGAQSIMIFGNNGQNEIRAGNSAAGGYLDFYTNNTADYTSSSNGNFTMRLASNGNVGIGTTVPDTKLAVLGTIHANEVKVDLSVPGPDYVFNYNYKLPKLSDLKVYVDKNHHLPEIPSAEQMAKDGLNLGDMNTRLLKKVEELTLYIIEKDRQLAAQQKVEQEQQEKLKQEDLRIAALEKALLKLTGNK